MHMDADACGQGGMSRMAGRRGVGREGLEVGLHTWNGGTSSVLQAAGWETRQSPLAVFQARNQALIAHEVDRAQICRVCSEVMTTMHGCCGAGQGVIGHALSSTIRVWPTSPAPVAWRAMQPR